MSKPPLIPPRLLTGDVLAFREHTLQVLIFGRSVEVRDQDGWRHTMSRRRWNANIRPFLQAVSLMERPKPTRDQVLAWLASHPESTAAAVAMGVQIKAGSARANLLSLVKRGLVVDLGQSPKLYRVSKRRT